jgi:PleD family two-component response regulator
MNDAPLRLSSHAVGAVPSTSRALLKSSSHPGRPLRILVVDNHVDTLKCIRLYLEQLGHSVHVESMRRGAGGP